MAVLARRRRSAPAGLTRAEQERSMQQRAIRWLGTTAITWPIWALTGAPTGLPQVTAQHHHVVATFGIWPVYLMVGGLADIARRARRLYVDPLDRPLGNGVDED